MKRNLLILFVLGCILLPSCLNNGKYETTPAISDDRGMLVNDTDTIGVTYLIEQQKYCLDTIAVEDTLYMMVIFDAVGNQITKASITYLNEFANLIVTESEELNEITTPTVTENSFSCTVVEGYRGIILELRYIPIKVGTGEMVLRVESDSEYSPAELRILTPIREKAVEPEPEPEPEPDPEPETE